MSIEDLKRRAGITEAKWISRGTPHGHTMLRDPGAQKIWREFWNVIQEAEEMGGPEGQDYIDLMQAIAQESSKRAKTYQETLDQKETMLAMSRILQPRD